MQAIHADSQTKWKQAVKNAILELDPMRLPAKLEAALNAIEARFVEVSYGNSTEPLELIELEDAKQTILALKRHEQQT